MAVNIEVLMKSGIPPLQAVEMAKTSPDTDTLIALGTAPALAVFLDTDPGDTEANIVALMHLGVCKAAAVELVT